MKWSSDEERVLEVFGRFVDAANFSKNQEAKAVLDKMGRTFMAHLERGAMMYGSLDLDTDDRDWIEEAGDEASDKIAYLICEYLKNPMSRAKMEPAITFTLATWAGLLDGRSTEDEL